MSAYAEHAAGLAELCAELGDDCPTLEWNTLSIRILPGGVSLRSSNTSGGFSLDSDFSFSCLSADFGAALPSSNQPIVYLGQKLKIDAVIVGPGGYQLTLKANHAAQGV